MFRVMPSLPSIDRYVNDWAGCVLTIVVCPVHHEIVVSRPLSSDRRTIAHTRPTGTSDACASQCQIPNATSNGICSQWQVGDHLRGVCVCDLRSCCVYKSARFRDLNFLSNAADCERDIGG